MPFFNVEKKKAKNTLFNRENAQTIIFLDIYERKKHNTHTTFKSNKLQKNDKKLRSKISDEKNQDDIITIMWNYNKCVAVYIYMSLSALLSMYGCFS